MRQGQGYTEQRGRGKQGMGNEIPWSDRKSEENGKGTWGQGKERIGHRKKGHGKGTRERGNGTVTWTREKGKAKGNKGKRE